jgi:hypothetical protein
MPHCAESIFKIMPNLNFVYCHEVQDSAMKYKITYVEFFDGLLL